MKKTRTQTRKKRAQHTLHNLKKLTRLLGQGLDVVGDGGRPLIGGHAGVAAHVVRATLVKRSV